jgi:hypothetical protein
MDHRVNLRMESVNLFGDPDGQAHPVRSENQIFVSLGQWHRLSEHCGPRRGRNATRPFDRMIQFVKNLLGGRIHGIVIASRGRTDLH